MEDFPDALNLIEYEALARALLPLMHFEYIAGGSDDEVTVAANRKAFDGWVIVPRVLRGVRSVDLGTTVLGQAVSMPVLMSPVAFQRLAHDRGEAASAAAAAEAGTIFCLSTLSTVTMEEVGRASGAWWFQLYCYSDRGVTRDLIQRAEAAGAGAILVTVDTPLLGRREADERNKFALPQGVGPVNLMDSVYREMPKDAAGSGLQAYITGLWDATLSWDDFDWIQSQTKLPVGVKGVLAAEDAAIACEHGASLIVVSNHGGRQPDHSIPTMDALPAIVDTVAGRCEILLDGGVRRGTDVVKALALGARGVMIGRPYVWGLAHGGQAGALHVLELLRAELELDMTLCGCTDLSQVSRELITRVL
jgi:4-hydroxymandelate oxidase